MQVGGDAIPRRNWGASHNDCRYGFVGGTHKERCRRGNLVGDTNDGRVKGVAGEIDVSPLIPQRWDTRQTDCHAHSPLSKGPSMAIVYDDADLNPRAVSNLLPQPTSRGVRISG